MNLRRTMMFALICTILAAALPGCCPGKGKDSPFNLTGTKETATPGVAKIGETLRVGDSEFVIFEALRKDSLSHYKTGAIRKASGGYFLEVHGKFVNKSTSTKMIETPFVVYDSQNRKVEDMDEQDDFLPDSYLSIWTEVKPNETLNWGSIFELPADAKGIKIELHDVGAKPMRTQQVDLGL
mgnify:CR=1 FL=1